MWCLSQVSEVSGVASAISEGDVFIYSCSAQLSSFEVDSISKEINCAEHEYMNMSPSLVALATPRSEVRLFTFFILNSSKLINL